MFNQKSRYDANSTMEMLGYQTIRNVQHEKMFEDVLDAHLSDSLDCFSLAMDMFDLGIICGKRLERARRKAARG